MNQLTGTDFDSRFVQDRQLVLLTAPTHSGTGSLRRAIGSALVRLGEWLRGKTDVAIEMSPTSPATTA